MRDKIDVKTPLTQTEAGRIRTILQGRGVRNLPRYHQLMTFSPSEVVELPAFKIGNMSAEDIAKLAGRE